MDEAEFADYLSWAVADYADELLRNTGIGPEEAERHARRSFDEAIPLGLATPGHRLLSAADAETGEHVGLLWIARQQRGGLDVIWIFDIWVDEPVRGRGYGRALMELAQEEAERLGVDRIELNVYGDNQRARTLYESLGYTEMSRQMVKVLDKG
jgi:GNAT superfamily N-acetyltransferase